MMRHRTPGVYFEWLDTSPVLQVVRTDIAGFVGLARRGPLHTPTRVETWNQFTSLFGAHLPQAYLAQSVQGFFANGGRVGYIVRVADALAASCASLDLADNRRQDFLRLVAISPGAWGNEVTVTARVTGDRRFTLLIREPGGGQETWRDLTWGDPTSPRDALKLLNGEPSPLPGHGVEWRQVRPGMGGRGRLEATLGRNCAVRTLHGEPTADPGAPAGGSRIVRAVPPLGSSGPPLVLNGVVQVGCLQGGADGLRSLRPEHLSGVGAPPDVVWGLATLEAVPEVAIVAMPDIMRPPFTPTPWPKTPPRRCDQASDPPPPPLPAPDPEWPPAFDADEIRVLQMQLVGHCERFKNRVALLDPYPSDAGPEAVKEWRTSFDTSYAALYYPWLRVPNPFQGSELLQTVPPCGYVAGVYARVENEVGVHKPPANERLIGVDDVSVAVDDITHGDLNDGQVNVVRAYPGRGLRVAGARTLSSDPLWRFVNVRRLLIMIERAIDTQTQWIVFEPNSRDLWRDVRRVTTAFLDSIWRRGMLDGATPAEAYSVTCDERTTGVDNVDAGRLITVIGVQPPLPAEFVIVRIGKTEAGTEVLEQSRG